MKKMQATKTFNLEELDLTEEQLVLLIKLVLSIQQTQLNKVSELAENIFE